MEPQTNTATEQPASQPVPGPQARIFGVGSTGLNVIEQMIADGLSASNFVAVHSDAAALGLSSAAEKVAVETKLFRGLGTGGDPERGRAAAEEHLPRLKSLCESSRVVMIIAGLGGGAGTGIGPVLAAAARETGALVIAFVVLPFPCEGSLRVQAAQAGLERFKEAADLVVTLPNEKTVTLEEGTSLVDTFKASNRLLAKCLSGPWLAVGSHSVMGLSFSDLCALLRQHSASCHFALAEASGPNRAAEAADLLFAHPLLQAAGPLTSAPAVAVFVLGGVGLGMVEVNRIMERVQKECLGAPVVMGAAVSAEMSDSLRVGILAASQDEPDTAPGLPEDGRVPLLQGDVNSRLVITPVGQRPGSRLGASAPSSLPSDHLERLTRQQVSAGGRPRKTGPRMRQAQLPLEIVSKGRFEKSEPTIHKGEDLDVPTYIRRGISLN